MKVIFLDIDGVLASFDYIRVIHTLHEKNPDSFGYAFDPRCVKCLQIILNECPDVKIVLSSTWKHMGLKKVREMWKSRDLPGDVIDITPNFDDIRGREIAEWISQNNVERYVIIDDDSDMLPYQMDFFVHTGSIYGLNLDDSKKAIKILNG